MNNSNFINSNDSIIIINQTVISNNIINSSLFIVAGNGNCLVFNSVVLKNLLFESVIFQFKTKKSMIFSIYGSEFDYNIENTSLNSTLLDISGLNVIFKAENSSFIQNLNFNNIISISNTFSDIYLEKIILENNSANELIYFKNVGII